MRGAEFAELEVFIAIAQLKSLRRAGEQLNLSPSAVSHSLRALERRLHAKLLNRTTRSVALTDAGQRLLERVEPAFAEIVAAAAATLTGPGKVSGVVRLNMPREASRTLMEPLISRFCSTYPNIQIEIFIDELRIDIVKNGCDAGIRLGDAVQLDMVAVRLSADMRGVVVGSPEYFSTHPVPSHPADLRHHRCINYRSAPGSPIMKWEFARGGEKVDVAVEGPLTSNDTQLQLSAALDGLGLACLTECTVLEHLQAKKLVLVLDDWCERFVGWHLYYPKSRVMVPAVQTFIDFCKAYRA